MRRAAASALVPALLAAVGLAACGGQPPATVTVVASWSGDDARPFRQVLDAFERETGIRADYQGTRDVGQVLRSGVDRNRPPDVAVLPRLNDLQAYARRAELLPLDDVLAAPAGSDLAPQLLHLRPARDAPARPYGLSVVAHAKSLVWYAPTASGGLAGARPPGTWAELLRLTGRIESRGGVPWCLGMGAQPLSGWPGTDWIEDILLHRSGPSVYQRWATGELEWRSPEVRDAWRAWGELVGAGGRTDNVLLSTFDSVGRGMFASPPSCFLDHQGSFIVASYRGSDPDRPAPGFDFFPFPPFEATAAFGPVREISEDVVGMFRDTAQSRALIRYLAGEPARRIWREASGHLTFTLNGGADPAAYPEGLPRRIASALATATLCRDASDLMPATMTAAFQSAVLRYLDDPGLLDALLTELDIVRSRTPGDGWLRLPCLSPRR
ncbi:ABC transporter substrate-binding protein [Micromonospora okii]|uniref:ABC transporter substrate-binding protein n=1 Tax=Micromonospora okii TaxID=1182970 RepID=UPI001E37117D|nr:extracellular solute-binding protein [Micromonospora okii]